MHIWVDADACPNIIKNILFRAVERTGINMTLVANKPLQKSPSLFVKQVQVSAGFDVADHYIVSHTQPGDLVITGDIPLAYLVIEKGSMALDPRGELYSNQNINQRLA